LFPLIIIKLHPQSLLIICMLRVFLSMLPPDTHSRRPSTSTHSLRPISTIIGRKCGRALIMPPVGAQDRQIIVCFDPCTTPLIPSVWLICTTGERGRRFHYLAGVTWVSNRAIGADCSISFMQRQRHMLLFLVSL
jgi:hypothetical protein